MEKLIERDGSNYRINLPMLDDISKIIFDNIRNVGLSVLVGGSGVLYFASHPTTYSRFVGLFLSLLSYALLAFNLLHAAAKIYMVSKHKYFTSFFVALFYVSLISLLVALQSSTMSDIEKKTALNKTIQQAVPK